MRSSGAEEVAPAPAALGLGRQLAQLSWVAWLLVAGCGAAQAEPAAPLTRAEAPAASPAKGPGDDQPTTTADAAEANRKGPDDPATAAAECRGDFQAEQPVEREALGTGDRLIRVTNAAEDDLQVRLLGANERPFLPGTLRIAPRETAVFHVPAGTYQLRYRDQSTCEVLRGSKIVLTGRRTAVEIALRPGARKAAAGVSGGTEAL